MLLFSILMSPRDIDTNLCQNVPQKWLIKFFEIQGRPTSKGNECRAIAQLMSQWHDIQVAVKQRLLDLS